jgi:hypothetical protein
VKINHTSKKELARAARLCLGSDGTKLGTVPQVLCKITKVLGVQGAQAPPKCVPGRMRRTSLRLFATRLHPGQVAPQSHGWV